MGGVTHKYYYQGSLLTAELWGSNALYFHYDANGAPIGFTYKSGSTETEYFYRRNLQGDIVGIVNTSGGSVAEYVYDAWGKVLTATGTMAAINPLRYRGYYYDTETGLYYVSSRYYDPEICRWINADSKANTGQGFIGCNMFSYCLNNPTNYIDINGKDAVVLYDKNFPGHIGALIQDDEGNWWHFYWGTANNWTRAACFFTDVPPLTWCVSYTGEIDLDQINADESYGGSYDEKLYLKGDFSDSVAIAKDPGGLYNLRTNNCAQVTLRALAASDTVYRDALNAGSIAFLPKNAFAIVKREIAEINRSPRKRDFYNYYEWNYATAV